MKRIAIPCLIVLLSFTCSISFGQKLKAVLVKLSSEKNRIQHFESKGDMDNANYLRKDADEIIKVTIGDFEAHFHACNVYYFVDTNLNEVTASNFTGILLGKDLKPVTNAVLKNGDSSFAIVYYGVPDDVVQDNRDGTIYRSGGYPNDGLVLLGHDYKRMKNEDHFILPPFYIFHAGDRKIMYTSKRFSLEYKPYARVLDTYLSER